MKVLVGKCFGIGNAVMSIPILKAIKSLPEVERLDVLIGSLPDDAGSIDVFKYLGDTIDSIYVDAVPLSLAYDVAIMSIPFDGRWVEGIHFKAKSVLDGRPRPIPSSTGLSSWLKHEVEYQMENAECLGYSGDIPDTSFYPLKSSGFPRDVYFGVGYKKDEKGFWKQKHIGNDRFATIAMWLLSKWPDLCVWSTGDFLDWKMTLQPIQEKCEHHKRLIVKPTTLDEAFDIVHRCGVYFGNDTGMMHVAASMGLKCVVPFFLENSIVKSSPWGDGHFVVDCSKEDISDAKLFEVVEEMIDV